MKTKFIWIPILLLFIGLIAWWLYSITPKGVDYSKDYSIQGRDHIADGAEHPSYNSNPPTSGWHYAEPANEGFYDTALPDERIIHNLEHGDIWIAYHPRISDATKQELKSAFSRAKIILTPREKNDFDISLVGWGRLDSFNLENGTLDKERIENFIKRYINTGPEKIMPGLSARNF